MFCVFEGRRWLNSFLFHLAGKHALAPFGSTWGLEWAMARANPTRRTTEPVASLDSSAGRVLAITEAFIAFCVCQFRGASPC